LAANMSLMRYLPFPKSKMTASASLIFGNTTISDFSVGVPEKKVNNKK